MRAHLLLSLVAGMGLAGCGGSGEPGPEPAPTKNVLSFETGEFEAPPGDSFECFYTSTTTDRELNVSGATGQQGPGGHHVVIYYTDATREPTHHPCVDSEMALWFQVAGADSNKEPVLTIPEGAAVKVPAGKQLVIQSHYINTTGATEKVNDKIAIELLEAKDVKQFINFWTMVDLSFQLPPNAATRRVTTCTVTEDLSAVILVGHMHDLGTHYKLETIDAKGTSLSTFYEHDWEPQFTSHPPAVSYTLDKPFVLKAGTQIRQTCDWNNTTPDSISFPREMCLSFVYYYPDKGYLVCEGQPVAQP